MDFKTLHVIASMDPKSGGPCQGLRNSIPSLLNHGFDNEVVTLDSPDQACSTIDPFPVHRLGPADNPWAYSSRLTPWLNENLRRFNIVLVHGLWLHHTYATYKAVKKERIRRGGSTPKLLLMSHGMLDPWFQRHPSRRLKAWRNWLYWKIIEKDVVNHADGILFTCEQELLLARETFAGYHPKRELNVGYGVVDPPLYAPDMRESLLKICPAIAEKRYLLFISRIHPKKGVDLLLRAYAKQLGDGDASVRELPDLVIAGPAESSYAREMIQLARGLGLMGEKAKVHFVGMLQGDAKWGVFHGCEAFVLPSHQENFGIAVAEALACNKPVLISDQVNIWREIESSGAGFVANDNDEGTNQLLDRWFRLTESEKAFMGANARDCYAQHFDIAVSTRRMIDSLKSAFA